MKSATRSGWREFLPKGVLTTTLLAVLVSSCQKIISIDLNSTSPRLVIEGVITDSAGPFHVILTKSGSYFDQPVIPPVSGAFVRISDDQGNVDTLKEAKPGIYFTSKIRGIPGRSYTLQVKAENKEYEASTLMKTQVAIDSLTVEESRGFGGQLHRSVICHFHDPKGEKNYYRVKYIKNDTVNADNYRLYDDQYTDGEEISMRAGNADAGDYNAVVLLSIDKKAYEYYHTLEEILRTNPFFGSTPANPNTNLSNGALGYFAAYTVSVRTIRIK
jgi:hypothetical protein